MLNCYFSRIEKISILRLAMVFFMASASLLFFSFSTVHADTIMSGATSTTSTPELLNKSIFDINDFSTVLVQPQFMDGSTNIAFYLDIDGAYIWQAEQLGSLGVLPFINYWDVSGNSGGGVGSYVAVEYLNDGQQFSCSGLSLGDCIGNPHFIGQFNFQIVDSDGANTSTIVANSTVEVASTTPSLVDALSVATTTDATSTAGTLDIASVASTTDNSTASSSTSTIVATSTDIATTTVAATSTIASTTPISASTSVPTDSAASTSASTTPVTNE
jgi:hypothetical protein